jgi:ubiquinone biosynthesis protein
VLLRLFEAARRFDMEVQPQLILLQKTLFNIEGLGRQLYPELDLWKTARPILRDWMRDRMSPRSVLRHVRAHLPDTIESMKQLPQILQAVVRDASDGRFRLRVEGAGVAQLRRELSRGQVRRDATIAACVLWLSGILWLAFELRYRWLGWMQMSAGFVLFIWNRAARVRLE